MPEGDNLKILVFGADDTVSGPDVEPSENPVTITFSASGQTVYLFDLMITFLNLVDDNNYDAMAIANPVAESAAILIENGFESIDDFYYLDTIGVIEAIDELLPDDINEEGDIVQFARRPPKFKESDHPRDRRGRFSSGSGGGGGGRSVVKKKKDKIVEPPKITSRDLQKSGLTKRLASAAVKAGALSVGAMAAISILSNPDSGDAGPSGVDLSVASSDEAVNRLKEAASMAGIQIPDDVNISLEKDTTRAIAEYNAVTNTLYIPENLNLANQLIAGEPSAWFVAMHEMSHAGEEIDPNLQNEQFLQVPDPSALTDNDPNIRNMMGHFEGLNQVATRLAYSEMVGQPIVSDDDLRNLSISYMIENEVNDAMFYTDPYREESYAWSGMAVYNQQLNGQSPREFILDSHDNGFSLTYTKATIQRLFPDRMASYSGTNDIPAPSTVLNWLGDIDVDGEASLRAILEDLN